jgi:hypothetical protein
MADFPEFMRNPANLIRQADRHTLAGGCGAGVTRTIHAFGGHRADREPPG